MIKTTSLHSEISAYLERNKRDYLTEGFGFSAYNAPNTMYNVSNDLDDILIKLPLSTTRVWHRTMKLLKRNSEPTIACTVIVKYDYYKDLMSRKTYFKAMKELKDIKLFINTSTSNMIIVNVKYANKLYKPKLEL